MSKIKYFSQINLFWLMLLAVLLVTRPAYASDEATTWCERDCKNEYFFFKRYAGQGSSLAKLSLAIMNYRGHGRDINVETGNRYLQKAARDEEPLAMYQLGYFLMFGLYMEQDFERALTWLKKASQHKIHNSKQLAQLLESHLSGSKSEQLDEAIAVLRLPAEPGKDIDGSQTGGLNIERISIIHSFTWQEALKVSQEQTCKTNCYNMWGSMLYPRIKSTNEKQLLNSLKST